MLTHKASTSVSRTFSGTSLIAHEGSACYTENCVIQPERLRDTLSRQNLILEQRMDGQALLEPFKELLETDFAVAVRVENSQGEAGARGESGTPKRALGAVRTHLDAPVVSWTGRWALSQKSRCRPRLHHALPRHCGPCPLG